MNAFSKTIHIRCLPVLVCLILLFACKNDDLPTAPRFRLKREVEQFGVNLNRGRLETTTYSYNGRGNIASFTLITQDNYNSRWDTVRGALMYDSDHRLIKCTTKLTRVGRAIDYTVTQTDFSYDTKGDMMFMKAYGALVGVGRQPPSPLPFVAQSSFTYNNDHQPIKEIYEQDKAVSPYIDQYQYTWKDTNIAEVAFTSDNPILIPYNEKLLYDNKVNPYVGLYFRSGMGRYWESFWAGTLWGSGIKHGYIANIYSLNRNNLLLDDEQLSYNAQGLLVKRVGNQNNRNFYFLIDYEYEEY